MGGSGVGVVVLKRLADALADGDTIHAVILGSAVNNDGAAKVGYTAPSVAGQAAVIAAALADAGVVAGERRLRRGARHRHAARRSRSRSPPSPRPSAQASGRAGFCALGSVKTNLGHLDAAAGVTGLIKTVLALEHRQIPPSLHFAAPNPAIDFAASPFRVSRPADRLDGGRGARAAPG